MDFVLKDTSLMERLISELGGTLPFLIHWGTDREVRLYTFRDLYYAQNNFLLAPSAERTNLVIFRGHIGYTHDGAVVEFPKCAKNYNVAEVGGGIWIRPGRISDYFDCNIRYDRAHLRGLEFEAGFIL